ncbi:L,D-transpeptidase [Arthrobacter sp. H14]|uniref:L,D-transpeptidase n=1 Tax=Arthrobacter sp. H14 TaxID=1312959 RepID=UPI0004B9000D|nr:Ig-like domain-containing protein [Arthrobacter sp. H14]
MSEQKSNRRGWKIGALVTVVLLLVGGGIGAVTLPTWVEQNANSSIEAKIEAEAESPARSTPGMASPVVEEMKLRITPADGAVEVNPATAPALEVQNGTVESVKLVPASGGGSIEGKLSDGGQVWTAAERLAFNTQYNFTYTVVDGAGRETTKTRSFTTVVPANEANAWTYPLDGMTVGVGQPLQINFSEPVLNKARIEEAISITTSAGQSGEFHWYNDEMLRYRPKEFWEPNSTITIDFKLFGVEFGNGMIGNHDSSVTVNIADKKVAIVDNKTKEMKAYINGELVRTMPATLGMKEWPSTSGVHVVMGQQRYADFNAGTIGLEPGDEHYYPPLTVEYASRISQSGEFVHAALEEALPYLGSLNVSHGCIGLSEANAGWFYKNFGTGDVVKITNSNGAELAPLDGYGDWNISWEDWTQE